MRRAKRGRGLGAEGDRRGGRRQRKCAKKAYLQRFVRNGTGHAKLRRNEYAVPVVIVVWISTFFPPLPAVNYYIRKA
jgi:hypothetical protein